MATESVVMTGRLTSLAARSRQILPRIRIEYLVPTPRIVEKRGEFGCPVDDA